MCLVCVRVFLHIEPLFSFYPSTSSTPLVSVRADSSPYRDDTSSVATKPRHISYVAVRSSFTNTWLKRLQLLLFTLVYIAVEFTWASKPTAVSLTQRQNMLDMILLRILLVLLLSTVDPGWCHFLVICVIMSPRGVSYATATATATYWLYQDLVGVFVFFCVWAIRKYIISWLTFHGRPWWYGHDVMMLCFCHTAVGIRIKSALWPVRCTCVTGQNKRS